MQRRTILAITILAAALLTAPGALGSWKSLGGYEPDTVHDETGGRMWLDSNEDTVRKVYLNVVPSNPDTAVNPNVAALGSRIQPVGKMGFEAFYGVWVDCNRDGYIGHAETAMFEYRNEILIDQSLCPLGTEHNARDVNAVSSGWVSELRWISPPSGVDRDGDAIPDGRDGRSFHDIGARIWGDYGIPGDTMGGERCVPIEPVNATATFRGAPRGTYQSTGAFLDYADCYTSHKGFSTLAPTLAGAGFGFDAEHTEKRSFNQEGHPLNQPTLGRSDYNQTIVSAYDCSGRRERIQTGVSDAKTEDRDLALGYRSPYVEFTNGQGELSVELHWNRSLGATDRNSSIREVEPAYRIPRAGTVDTDGSVAGTYAHTTRGASTECDPGDKGGDIYSYNEGDVVPELAAGKNRVTVRFGFYEEQRSGKGQRGNPFEGGVYPGMRGAGVLFSGSRWYWEADTSDPPVLPQLIRSDDMGVQGGAYWTFYANMSASLITTKGLSLPQTTPGSYGDDWCEGVRSGAVRGFVCEPDKWYRGADGSLARDSTGRPLADYYPKIGHAYYLRDVDCFDGSVARGQPVYASGALLSEDGPCEDARTP